MAQQHRHSRRSTAAAAPAHGRGRSRSAWLRHTAAAAGKRGSQQGSQQADALFSVAQCELVEGFLPPELARQLLLQLQVDEHGWGKMQWWIGNNSAAQPGLSSKTSAHYQLTADSVPGADSGDCDGEQGSTGGAWLPAPQCCATRQTG